MKINKLLKKARKNQHVVSFFRGSGWSDFSLGYVDELCDGFVRIKSLNKFGERVGYEIVELNDIEKIQINGLYESKTKQLNERFEKSNKYAENNLEFSKGENLLDVVLDKSTKEELVISLWLTNENDSITGIVQNEDDGIISLLAINEYGDVSGNIFIYYDDVAVVDINGKRELSINYLYMRKKSVMSK